MTITFETVMPDSGEPWRLSCTECRWTAYVTPRRIPQDLPEHPGHEVICH